MGVALHWRGLMEWTLLGIPTRRPPSLYWMRMRFVLVLSVIIFCCCAQRPSANETACIDRAARLAAPTDGPEWPGRHTIESRTPHFSDSSGHCYLLIKHRVHGADLKGAFSSPYETLLDVDTGQTIARCGDGPMSCRIGREYAVDCDRCRALIDKSLKE